ncbi:hypothetical protein KOW79_016524 [Hemibagrus wyckioides]|uniref:Uncharacterized protein n=1 Tax=Hemibagrus wyckioides TaxID=337641 RepID=A0A9D3NDC4_9TELE|nr:hypothetical protein KOW79_016524 [Hemibagrus wyckioides]
MGEKAEYYDDVMDTSDIISDPGRVDPPEDYDDAVTAGPIPDHVDEDEAENYDDAITADQKSVILTEDVSENYDDAVTTETNPNIITDHQKTWGTAAVVTGESTTPRSRHIKGHLCGVTDVTCSSSLPQLEEVKL